MKTEIYELLKLLRSASEKKISPTINDYAQFEKNIYHFWLSDRYGLIIKHLDKLKPHIGSQVWPYKSNFEYSITQNSTSILNKTEELPIILTETLYKKYEIDFLTYVINGLLNELLNNSPMYRSTSLFSNLAVLVEIEAKQEMVKELRKIIDN